MKIFIFCHSYPQSHKWQMNKMGKIASHIFVLFFIPVYFSNNLLYDFFVKK